MKKSELRTLSIVVCFGIAAYLGVSYFVLNQNVLLPAVITFVFAFLLILVFATSEKIENETSKAIENSIDNAVNETLKEGSIGVLVYNDNYEITWMSAFFKERAIDQVGEKVLTWLPDLQDLIQGNTERCIVNIGDDTFSISKKDNSSYLMFRDVTTEYKLNRKIADDAYVMGIVNFDNYDEYRENDDDMSFINSNIKVPVIDYFKKYNVVYKTLRSSKMLIVLNEKSYRKLVEDKFSILDTVKSEAKKGGLDITLTIGIARGSDNLDELDDEAQELLELGQSRGGDQVVCRKLGEEVIFFGGSSEAKEERSRVKTRVLANSIRDIISKADNVIIVGHKEMDADCLGSALCMSNISNSLNKDTYILCKSGGIEAMINEVFKKYDSLLTDKHHFVNETEAINLCNENTLVIMVDHHMAASSNGSELLKNAKNIIIVDHHRRKADLDIDPLLIYIQAAASSTCELAIELLNYMPRKIDILAQEANIMYLGILIDTDRFRVRTNNRTFDALKQLRDLGADPTVCDELAAEPFEQVNKRTQIINSARKYRGNIAISSMNEGIYNRSIASQACDMLVKIREIEAAFVICMNDKNEVVVSARSKGNINVQVIIEKMNGGGHMTAAGLQRKDTTVAKVENELLNVLEKFFKEEKNEGNTII